uniref:Uncharacterized protein n=1 Tax=Anopheles coluzzii TaxID=1518534 RepID=A0A8W7PMS1_ANOCL
MCRGNSKPRPRCDRLSVERVEMVNALIAGSAMQSERALIIRFREPNHEAHDATRRTENEPSSFTLG